MNKKEYRKLLNAGVKELQFYRLKEEHLKSVLSEVETLLNERVPHKLIKQVIKNGMERDMIDTSIHNFILC